VTSRLLFIVNSIVCAANTALFVNGSDHPWLTSACVVISGLFAVACTIDASLEQVR